MQIMLRGRVRVFTKTLTRSPMAGEKEKPNRWVRQISVPLCSVMGVSAQFISLVRKLLPGVNLVSVIWLAAVEEYDW
jgi:hypothetical protein